MNDQLHTEENALDRLSQLGIPMADAYRVCMARLPCTVTHHEQSPTNRSRNHHVGRSRCSIERAAYIPWLG